MGIFGNIQSPYRPVEAWFYDRYIAPGLATWTPLLLHELEPFMASLPTDARVLDVGCGGGHFVTFLADAHPDFRLTGVDLSHGQVVRARRRSARLGARVQFIEGSATALPFDDAAFDLVVSIGSLKHWPDRRMGLSECVRVLRPGRGLLICEADPDTSPDDIGRMAKNMHVPFLVRGLLTHVAARPLMAQSPRIDEVKAWLADLPIENLDVHRSPTMPAYVVRGNRRSMH
jgi:SAM-dependent methyltransferase